MSYFNRHVLIIELLKMFQPICKFQVVKLLSWKKNTFKKSVTSVGIFINSAIQVFEWNKLSYPLD